MKLINNGRTPRYCQLAGCSVRPGHATRELDSFTASWKNILEKSRGFDIVLSEDDVSLLSELCAKYLVPLISEEFEKLAGVDGLVETLRNPDGLANIRKRARDGRAMIQKIRAEAMRREAEREARIQAESNIIGPDGNPIPKVSLEAKDAKFKDLKPVRHDDMTTDLKSVIENNLAVMTTASGQRLDKMGPRTVMATPGGTPVPTDPAAYRKPRTVPAGQPELP